MWRWQSVQEFQYPLIEYLAALKDLPLFIGVESVVAGHEHTSMSVITGQMPASLDTAPLPTGPNARRCRRVRPTPRSATPTRSRSGSTASTAATRTPAAAPPTAGTARVPGSANAADPSWNATAAEADPRRRRRHGQPRPQQDGRSAEVDGRVPSQRQLLRARPPGTRRPVQPGRQQRLQRRAPARLQQRRAADRVRHGDAARPRRLGRPRRILPVAQQHRRRADRQRRRHDLRRHRRLRRADRRRVGRAAGRGPQLLVLRQLRLAQPRQLRSRRPPLDAGLLPRRVPAQLHAGAQRGGQAAARRRSSTACARGNNFTTSGQIIDRLGFVACVGQGRRASWPSSRRTPPSTRPRSARRAAPRWARSWWCRRAPTSSSASRCATRRGRTLAVHLPQPVAAAGRHQPAAEHAGARPHRPHRRSGHRLQDARNG